MAGKNTPDAKNRILQAAIKIFAAKSFEGSRIDEIAQEAKVPKSLIYYHFKSKDEILEVLMQGFIDEYSELVRIAESDTHQKKAEEMSDRLQHYYRDFAMRNTDLIRVILMDSLKKSTERPIIYKFVETMVDTEAKFAVTGDVEKIDRNERLVAEFFTGIIPTYAYLCFADSWIRYFGMERKDFDKLFFKILTATHGAYHKNHE